MNKYFYDLHIHSCASPCADNDMTPANIAGMAALNGLQIIALTDHNTTANCPAFMKACARQGLIGVPGMELTTAEDIHIICLFESLEPAMAFGSAVGEKRIKIKNRVEIFGDQLFCDEEDNIIGTEDYLLPNATTLSLDEAYNLAVSHGAAVYPAHIDRQANGIISTLGDFPEVPSFCVAEFNDSTQISTYKEKFSVLDEMLILTSSDAHNLWVISEAEHSFLLEDEPYSGTLVRHNLIEYIKWNSII